ncbi:S1 RNA binding domain protein [Acinetobacter baumannii 44467_7]|nr:S1 RNA binding domain protein [Acinetobacter baumannii 44467_7]
MTESFAALFEESELNLNVEKGAVIQGVVVNIDSDWVTVDTGLKSEGIVDRAEFLNEQRELEVQVGDTVDVVVEALDNGMGQTVLSREKAKRAKLGLNLKKSLKMAKSLLVLSLIKLKAVSLLTSVLFVRSYQAH